MIDRPWFVNFQKILPHVIFNNQGIKHEVCFVIKKTIWRNHISQKKFTNFFNHLKLHTSKVSNKFYSSSMYVSNFKSCIYIYNAS